MSRTFFKTSDFKQKRHDSVTNCILELKARLVIVINHCLESLHKAYDTLLVMDFTRLLGYESFKKVHFFSKTLIVDQYPCNSEE